MADIPNHASTKKKAPRGQKNGPSAGLAAGGARSRRKGARGQAEASALLLERDWHVDRITAGIAAADLVATDPSGRTWACEVKNTVSILPAHRKQAMQQAAQRRLPWMLMSKISGTSSWLIQRQGDRPAVWHVKGGQ